MSKGTTVTVTLTMNVTEFKAMSKHGRCYLDFVASNVQYQSITADGLPDGWKVAKRGGPALSLYFEREAKPMPMAGSVDLAGWYAAIAGKPVALATMPTGDMHVWHPEHCKEWTLARDVAFFSALFNVPTPPAMPAPPALPDAKPARGRKPKAA